ncbi:alpha-ketoglutarate-dependent dioxygenase AlkB [Jatrophihabitans endophyticus]|uniref:alpha-ketoglutarate-dependent dioxygenase AlkB n=1 Tax=Jatrophihabitans endophyticus TaxID=1206085 RepID=UPI0019E46797|nr:alpha-ketoglutarate-dependent dioxygenase AlkB [Jatrophihabitans endophyticus]MBE7190231.1 alpha-ketoglutarate-dependent dioxygenase AlkB [Jatrophihabitans endophyticus]
MTALGFQASLLDDGAAGEIAPGELGGTVRRTELGDGAWVDLRPRWIAGADALFEALRDDVAWHAERRPMYDRVVAVPRLLCFVGEDEPLPHPALVAAKASLDAHYRAELGERFATAGLCLYRDGRDSVAWHGDRIGRGSTHDTMVAIVVLGETRTLALRPRPGVGTPGPSRRLELGHGDLVVMGGSCQRTWEHAVPKTSRAVGPRISVQFRPRGVR